MISVVTFATVLNQLLPEPHAGLLNGIIFGTKASLSPELTDALVTTGTLHIVALSGMNITILSGLMSSTLLWVVGKRMASLLTILLIAGFVWFVGASPSIVRAGIMGTVSLLAVVFGKQYWGLLTLILAVCMMLLLNPGWIGDISFQLSAAATLGIILFSQRTEVGMPSAGPAAPLPPTRTRIPLTSLHDLNLKEEGCDRVGPFRRVTRTGVVTLLYSLIRDDLRLTLAAQVFTIPLILWYFHRISLISPLANVLIGWVVPPLTVAGLLAAILGWIFLPLGQIIAWGAWVGLEYLITVVMILSKVPGASIGGN